PVCMRCGAPSSISVPRTFFWVPEQTFLGELLGFLIGFLAHMASFILRACDARKFRITMPLCAPCDRRRRVYGRTVRWGLVGVLALTVGGVRALTAANRMQQLEAAGRWMLAAAALGGLVLLVTGA